MRKYNQESIEKAYCKLLDQLKRAKLNTENKNELNISLSDWKNHFQVLNNSTDEIDQWDEYFINTFVEKENELIN